MLAGTAGTDLKNIWNERTRADVTHHVTLVIRAVTVTDNSQNQPEV
jgi:hypothetical protein